MKLNQLLRPLTRRTQRQLICSASRAVRVPMHVEPLESRQMLSLTVNVDVDGGGIGSAGKKTASVTSVGQVVTLDVYATVTGTQAVTDANTGFQSLAGSFLNTLSTGGSLAAGSDSVGGNLSTALPTFEYQANGAVQSTAQDLNGDGYLDSGSNNNSDIAGFFNARGGAVENDGTRSGDSETFSSAASPTPLRS